MVASVSETRRRVPNLVARALIDMCQRLPWERLLVTGGAVEVVASASQTVHAGGAAEAGGTPPKAAGTPKPGCAAADACLLVQGYLDGLSRGNGGFGVLALGKTRLEEGAASADQMGQRQLAIEVRAVAAQLPAVRTKEDAARIGQELRPVADKAWRLGRICGLTRKR